MPLITKQCAISVDLDGMRFYRAIHGLRASAGASDVWLTLAVRRLADFADGLGIPLTWFVVARDLEHDTELGDLLLGLCRRGHEIANHSLDHFYDLTRRGHDVMRVQVSDAAERLSRLTGKLPHGFRAPGYTMTTELAQVLAEVGVRYDSSIFPCPVYYGAKAVAMFGQRLRGRASAAILDEASVTTAPARPFRWALTPSKAGGALLELPIQVATPMRLPFIGTTLTLLGERASRWLTRSLLTEPFVNLELHAIDALDADDQLDELARVQPDLRRRWRVKLQIFESVITLLRGAGYQFVPLEQAATSINPTCTYRG
jgi:peptidoglycan/xylan/chitin deacetylase (PgdA/CDA1 family)